MDPWSLEGLMARIADRLRERGMTANDLPDSYRKGWKTGPTLGMMQTIADRLGWSLPQLLGVPAGAGDLDHEIMRQAMRVAAEAMAPLATGCVLSERADEVAMLVAQAYGMIADMAHDRPDLAFTDGALYSVASHLRSRLASKDLEKS